MKPRGPQRDRGPQKPGGKPRGPGNPGAFPTRGAPGDRKAGGFSSRGPSAERGGFSRGPAAERGGFSRGPAAERGGFKSRAPSTERGGASRAAPSDRKPGGFSSRGPSADRGGFKSSAPSGDRGGFKPRGPSADRGGFKSNAPSGERGGFKSNAPSGERGGFESRGSSSDRAGFKPRGPSADRGGFKSNPSALEGAGFKPRGPSADRGGFKSRAPSADRGGFKSRAPSADRGGFQSNAPSADRGGFSSRGGSSDRKPGTRGADRHAPKPYAPRDRKPAERGGFAERDFSTSEAAKKRPPRPELRPMSAEAKVFPAPSLARVGDWLFTTRPDAELDLQEELALQDPEAPLARVAGPALVAVPRKPKAELAFARQGFPVAAIIPADHPNAVDRLADALIDALPLAQGRAARARGPQKFGFDAWVPDDDRTNPSSAQAQELGDAIRAAVARRTSSWSPMLVGDGRDALADNGLYAQLCLVDGQCYVGVLAARDAQSVAAGGRLRVHLPQHAPSRAAAKLLEAFAWLDRAPTAGEMCVDLGAAPGGWTWVLLERGAKVLAIDPGKLDALVAKKKGLTHLRADAFKFEPDEPVDWLVADMAWRPLEAAALYGKWARRGWARLLVANIKLPMRKKAEYLMRVRDILETSGWTNLRARQLYHDREEVTVAAVRL